MAGRSLSDMSKECYSSQPPKVEVFSVYNGTDIILRKNIKKATKEPMEEGGKATTVYECDEIQFRHNEALTKTEVSNNFDYWWVIGEGGTEEEASDAVAEASGEPTIIERLEAVESAIIEIAEVLVNG